MHIKTNIEHNIVQVAILAICPLLLVLNSVGQALFYILTTSICFFVSAMVCKFYSKQFSRNIKIFVTAVISTFVLTILNFTLNKHTILGIETPENSYYAVLSTICLCLDAYFIDNESETRNYLFTILFDIIVYAIFVMVFGIIVELLSSGTFFGLRILGSFQGDKFFETLPFKFVLLGVICVIGDYIYRIYQNKKNEKRIVLEKYVKKIRDEKFFQYDDLRKKKLLVSKIEIKNVNEAQAEEINQKLAENQSVETEEEKKEDKVVDKEQQTRNEELKKKFASRKNAKPSNRYKESIEERPKEMPKQEEETEEPEPEENDKKGKKNKKDKKKKGKEKQFKQGSTKGSKVERVFKSGNSDKK